MTEAKVQSTLATKLARISARSVSEPSMKFDKLMPLFSKANLIQCFYELKGDRATGIDRVSKEDYRLNLESNIEDLIMRMKIFQYRPMPVREVMIPKDDGGQRPLGISAIEDKIVQLMYAKILSAIFEPHFMESSYGFRPNRNCHQAIQRINDYLFERRKTVIIDADIKNYFGTINHEKLIEFVKTRIGDDRFLRYLVRMLKAGILTDVGFRVSDEGTPQGAICSPVLSNIYAHFVLDNWIENTVKPRFPDTELIRYADDFVICCSDDQSASKIHSVLGKRLAKYDLKLHETKTKVVQMDKVGLRNGVQQGTFNFLGFTSYLDYSRSGKFIIPKFKTDRRKFRGKLGKVKEWVKLQRNEDFRETWVRMHRKLRGHATYYGISNNSTHVNRFIYESEQIFFKWMNRRSHKKSITWEGFNLFKKANPGTRAYVYHPLFPGYAQRKIKSSAQCLNRARWVGTGGSGE